MNDRQQPKHTDDGAQHRPRLTRLQRRLADDTVVAQLSPSKHSRQGLNSINKGGATVETGQISLKHAPPVAHSAQRQRLGLFTSSLDCAEEDDRAVALEQASDASMSDNFSDASDIYDDEIDVDGDDEAARAMEPPSSHGKQSSPQRKLRRSTTAGSP